VYNRPNYLKRILNYYNSSSINFDIVIADSSNKEFIQQDEEIVKSFEKLKIIYKKYSDDFNTYYYKKKADSLKYAETKYCLFCAVDDFITPEAINKSIEFLDKHSDYSCVHGDYISFRFDKKTQKFYWKNIYTYYKSIDSSKPEERLNDQFTNYIQTIYSVHRTNQLKMIFQENIKYSDDARFGEILPSLLDVIHGKMKRLNAFYCAREKIFDSDAKTCSTIMNFIKKGTYEAKYKKFRECLSEHLSRHSNLNLQNSRRVIDENWKFYMKQLKRNHHPIIYKFEKYFDYKIIKEFYRMSFRRNDYKSWTASNPPLEYFNDFNKIKNIVLLTSLE